MQTATDHHVGHNFRRRTDAEIAARVRNLLSAITTIPEEAVNVDVVNGIVLLSGTVRYRYQSQAIEHAIEHLGDVTKVDNRLNIGPYQHH